MVEDPDRVHLLCVLLHHGFTSNSSCLIFVLFFTLCLSPRKAFKSSKTSHLTSVCLPSPPLRKTSNTTFNVSHLFWSRFSTVHFLHSIIFNLRALRGFFSPRFGTSHPIPSHHPHSALFTLLLRVLPFLRPSHPILARPYAL
ncbi:hypothetical protein K439DRAFT_5624 [Ramaria rubella]|nr:hypothetical protein K439DRAFT_5624 [Ramaria rubella]